jgi:ubiquinone biosynthesis protein
MRERVGLRALLRDLRRELPDLIDAARALPPLLKSAIHQAQAGSLQVPVDAPAVRTLAVSLRASARRRDLVIVTTAVVLGGIIWLAVQRVPAWPGWLLLAGGALGLIAVLRR